jgi:hypothetical protein
MATLMSQEILLSLPYHLDLPIRQLASPKGMGEEEGRRKRERERENQGRNHRSI